MSTSHSRRFPVTVTHLPVTRCQICHQAVPYRPGTPSEVPTEHYRRAQPEAPGTPPGSRPRTPALSPQLPPQHSAARNTMHTPAMRDIRDSQARVRIISYRAAQFSL